MGALTLYSQNMICMMNFKPPASHGNQISKAFLEISNFMCPLQGLGLLGSLGQNPLFFDPHSLQGVCLPWVLRLVWVCLIMYLSHSNPFCQAYGIVVLHGSNQVYTEP